MLRTAYPLASICRVLELPRSTLYYQAQPRDDREVGQAIEAVAQQFPTYGGRRIAADARRRAHAVGVGDDRRDPRGGRCADRRPRLGASLGRASPWRRARSGGPRG